jgi:SAM-dependent methyltransferase
MHKTGSTALQWTLDVNRQLLKQNGVLYPNASPPPHEGIGHQGLVRGLEAPDQGASEWEPTLRELEQADQDVAVISSESFSSLRDEQVPLVRSFLEGYDVTVVVYLRRQDELLHGLYCTPVLFYGETREFQQWRRESYVDSLLDYRPLLARWAREFGREALIVRAYERAQLSGGGIVPDFAAATGLTFPPTLQELNRQITNRSYPRNAINMVRGLHQAEELERCVPEARRLLEILYQDQHTDADILSPEERLAILRECEKSNREIAREYLGRNDGRLFVDLSVPGQEDWSQRYGGRFGDLVATLRDAHKGFSPLAFVESVAAGSSYQQLQYSETVSPRDHMWNTASEHYFAVGLSAIRCVEPALATAEVDPRAILDMACGHGRVCRMLRARFPHSSITACDIDRDAVDFCADQFDAEPVYSKERVTDVRINRRFDLIWSGSFFTHMDQEEWLSTLRVLSDWLVPGGVLVFTTNGRRVVEWIRDREYTYGLADADQDALLRQYDLDGFAFLTSEFQPAGFSISGMPFVCETIEAMPSVRLIGYHEAGWAGHQDTVSVIRIADPPAAASNGWARREADTQVLAQT